MDLVEGGGDSKVRGGVGGEGIGGFRRVRAVIDLLRGNRRLIWHE